MYLGGYPSALYLPVINLGATTVARGCVASYLAVDETTITSAQIQRSQAAGLGPTRLIPVKVWTASTGLVSLGVAVNEIKQNEHGLLAIMGATVVRTTGTVLDGEELEATTNGVMQAYSAGTKSGIAITNEWTDEVVRDYGTATLKYALAIINFPGYNQ